MSLLSRCRAFVVLCPDIVISRRILTKKASPFAFRLYDTTTPRSEKTKKGDDSTTSTTKTLQWETFEFGQSPKWDDRFDQSQRAVVASNQEELDKIIQDEAKEDQNTKERMDKYWNALHSLTPELVERATTTLLPYVKDERVKRMEAVLRQRTQHTRFLFENPSNPSNVWACLRTIDSFGIQNVDLVIQSGKYLGKAALSQKRGMRTAMGSAQWLTLRNHLTTTDAISQLKNEGYRVYASDLNPNSKDIRDIQWGDSKVCIVMGNENDGISQQMRQLADETFTLPMVGFAESFNLSVATAITLAHLSASSSVQGEGPLRPGDLDQHQLNLLKLKGILNSIAQKKAGKALLKREGIVLPPELGWV